MIRLYPWMVERLWLCLEKLVRAGERDQDLRNFGRRLSMDDDNREVRTIAEYHVESEPPDGIPTDLEGLSDLLVKIMWETRNAKSDNDGDLIDKMVASLQLPYARNIQARYLQDLKRALLLPSEMAALGPRMMERELGCAGCGKPLNSGEMMTIQYRNGETTINCTRCAKPSYISCDYCGKATGLSKSLGAFFKKVHSCGCYEKKIAAADAAVAANPTPEPAPPGTINPDRVILQGPRVRDFLMQHQQTQATTARVNINEPATGGGVTNRGRALEHELAQRAQERERAQTVANPGTRAEQWFEFDPATQQVVTVPDPTQAPAWMVPNDDGDVEGGEE